MASASVDRCLRRVGQPGSASGEAAAQAMIAYSIDTSDPDKEADHLRFSTEVMPRMEERSVELAREAAGGARVVAASVGPYGAMLGNGAEYTGDYDTDEDELVEFHVPRIEALAEAEAAIAASPRMPMAYAMKAWLNLLGTEPGGIAVARAALQAADLISTLKSEGPFTVFAPTNAAFGKLPAGTVDSLLKPENKAQLTKILTCHVVSANAMSSAIKKMIKDDAGMHPVKTVGGCTWTAKLRGDSIVLVDAKGHEATVTIANVKQSNGVIHVIDTVLLPG